MKISAAMTPSIIRALGWLGIIAIAVLSLVPGQLRPETGASGHHEHIAAYFLTAVALALGYPRRPYLLGTFFTLYAGLLETAQFWVPGRMSRVTDFLASSFGACVGIIIVAAWHWFQHRRRAQAQ